MSSLIPPCQFACPAGVKARDYIALISQGRYADAINLIRERMPFTSACGRICYHPCETECNRALVDEPVAIMYLKRFVSDYAFQAQFPLPSPVRKTKEEKVAIIGAGPSGLTAAQDLVKMGYPVTVFETLPFPGGMLRAAIPPYRLPKELVDWDIQHILALGIELQLNVSLGKEFSLKELMEDKYRAIFVAIGADKSRKLSQPEQGVIAEGDLVFGTVWTVQATAAGHRAAELLALYLRKEKAKPQGGPVLVAKGDKAELESKVYQGQIKPASRPSMPLWQPGMAPLIELEIGYSEEGALQEARRCLNCGSAEVIGEKCAVCLTCLRVCPYEAPALVMPGEIKIRFERCEACGLCAGECPAKAISFGLPGLQDINPLVEIAMKRIKGEPKVVGFYCSFGVHTAITPTQVLKELPENIALIPVPCISKINSSHLLKPFELGADRVVVIGCVEEECRYRKSDFWVRRRMEGVRGILTGLGLEPESINIYNLSGEQFSQLGGFLYKEGSRLP